MAALQQADQRLSMRDRHNVSLALNASGILHPFPSSKCSINGDAKRVFIAVGMFFDGGMCPSNSPPSCRTNSGFCQYFRERACELVAQLLKIGFGLHHFSSAI
jgi:hypothetical protein